MVKGVFLVLLFIGGVCERDLDRFRLSNLSGSGFRLELKLSTGIWSAKLSVL